MTIIHLLNLIFLFALIIINPLLSQVTFHKTFGGTKHDFGQSFQQTSDGGYILFGLTASFGNGERDMYLIKTDYKGNESWSRTFGTEKYEVANSVQQTSDGGYILCGASPALGNDSLALIRTDATGNEVWFKKYRGSAFRDVGRSVQQAFDGGFIAAGFNGDSFIEDVFLLKTDGDGNEVWRKTYGGMGRDYGVSIRQTSDGGYVVAGQTNSRGNGGDDMYLLRVNSVGDTLWTKTYGTIEFEIAESVDITSDGGFAILGSGISTDSDLLLVKTNAEGIEEWRKYYGGFGQDIGYAVQQTADHGYILAGRNEDEVIGSQHMYCVKTDSIGEIQWESNFPKGIFSDASDVEQTSDGGYALFGATTREIDATTFDSDMYLVKINSSGNLSNQPGILVKASPNPFTAFTIIEFPNPGQLNYSLTLFDVQGKVISRYVNLTSGELKIERRNLHPGLYVLQLENGKEILGTGKLVVE